MTIIMVIFWQNSSYCSVSGFFQRLMSDVATIPAGEIKALREQLLMHQQLLAEKEALLSEHIGRLEPLKYESWLTEVYEVIIEVALGLSSVT